jgi:alpha-mannosidase
MSFQVKKWKGDTVHLIAYLNGLDRKFSKTAETLIIVFETINTEVHLEKIQTEIKEKRFPFKEIMLISANLLSQKIFICGAWPKIWRREVSFH